jgi:hypothetical protein
VAQISYYAYLPGVCRTHRVLIMVYDVDASRFPVMAARVLHRRWFKVPHTSLNHFFSHKAGDGNCHNKTSNPFEMHISAELDVTIHSSGSFLLWAKFWPMYKNSSISGYIFYWLHSTGDRSSQLYSYYPVILQDEQLIFFWMENDLKCLESIHPAVKPNQFTKPTSLFNIHRE